MFSSDPHALQVVAYYDEIEVVNPIGSCVKKHKFGCIFYFLATVRSDIGLLLNQYSFLLLGNMKIL